MSDGVVSDIAVVIFQWACYGFSLLVIPTFGTVTNIINIICFVKQGFKDSVNISLLGLAISDLASLVTLFFSSIFMMPALQQSNLPFNPTDLQYTTTGQLHLIFTRITSWITVLITLERCLCISLPLKVKNIFTPKRVTFIIVGIFIVLSISIAPFFYSTGLAWTFAPEKNKTILALEYSDDWAIIDKPFTAAYHVMVPLGAFFAVIALTIVLVIHLQANAKWRAKNSASTNDDVTSDRDLKVSKMVVLVSALFIACFIPLCMIFIAMMTVPGMADVSGKYKNTLWVLGGVSLIFESTNSSMNIFIYYHMSSRYRAVFQQMFARSKKTVGNDGNKSRRGMKEQEYR